MTIEELEKENAALKEKVEKMDKWMRFYEENERQRMWMEAAETSPQRNYEINRNYRMHQLPKL